MPNNQPEDILDGVEPVGQPTRPTQAPPPLSLEEVIARKKAGASFQRVAPPAAVPVPAPMTPPTVAPVDILSEVEVAETKVRRPADGLKRSRAISTEEVPPIFQPEQPEVATGLIVHEPPLLKNPKLFIIIAVVLGLGLLGGGGWLVYKQLVGPSSVSGPALPAATSPTTPQVNQPAVTSELSSDADLDGLPDAEEKLYGTNPNAVDSDNDALTDRDEVKIFKTDPNEPDSDGDGYKDGEEVRSGYDPKGSGRLFRTTP